MRIRNSETPERTLEKPNPQYYIRNQEPAPLSGPVEGGRGGVGWGVGGGGVEARMEKKKKLQDIFLIYILFWHFFPKLMEHHSR